MDARRWQRLAQELDELLELDSKQREKRLAHLAMEDARLAMRLRIALDADARPIDMLDQPLSLALEADVAPHEHAEAAVAAGDRVGPWRLECELGRGGMGCVWLASRDDGQYRLQVAIKLLVGVANSELMRDQLRRERQILADLDHPGIARLLDGGVREDGTPWYAMEYVQGVELNRYCRQQGLSVPERMRLLKDIAEAVHHAHAHLVVHRDLKPGNILVDAQGKPHLLDFGIAKLLDPAAAGSSMTLLAAATPAYAAPEQLRGEHVGTAADIYALGVIAHELVAGVRPPHSDPFEAAPESRGAMPSTAMQRSAVARRLVVGDVDAIVSTALAAHPADRYASAEALADDIGRWLSGRPVEARRAGAGYHARKFIRRHWLGVGLGAAAVVALCLALVFSLVQTRHARSELARANAVQGFLLGVFDAVQPSPGGNFVMTQRELADRAVSLLEAQLADQPQTSIDVLIAIGRVYRKLGFAERARTTLQHALRLLDARSGSIPDPRRVTALLELGRADYLAADYAAARTHLGEAARLASDSTPVTTQVAILYELGSSQSAGRDIQSALKTLDRAAALAATDPAAAPLLPKVLLEKALAQRRNHDIEAAIAEGRRALVAVRRSFGERDVRTAGALSTVGAMLRRAGAPAEAEKMLRQAVRIETEAYGEPQAATLNNLATVLQDRGQLAESGALFRQALKSASQRYGANAVTTASYRRNLALEQADAGHMHEALANLRKAYARYSDAYPPGSPLNLEMRAQLARLSYQAGEKDAAARLLPELLADAPKHRGTADIPLRQAHMLSARLALDAGDLGAARSHLAAARNGLQAHGLETTDRVRLKLLAGDIAQAAGQPAQAQREWRAARQLADTKLSPQHVLAHAAAQRLHTPL